LAYTCGLPASSTRAAKHRQPGEKKKAKRRWTMLLNNVPEKKKLAYLLGLQVERHKLGGSARLFTLRVAVTAVVVLLLSLWLISAFEWH